MARVITEVSTAAAALRRGELVAFATETVYGLGGVALWPDTVARIFEVKGRPTFDPLIVHVPDLSAAQKLVTKIPPLAAQLASRFWPGPLTLVMEKATQVPDLVTSGLPSVAIRIPSHPVALRLLREVGLPVAAPSANLFGRVSPTTAAHVQDQLGDRIEWILDGGPCAVGVESTVLNIPENGCPTLLRPGGVSLEEIEALIGPINQPAEIALTQVESSPVAQLAPGSLPQHYAPLTSITVSDLAAPPSPGRWGVLAFRDCPHADQYAAVEVLSPDGNLTQAAAGLFAAMRRLDSQGLDGILTERFPEEGLGRAINDRLRRAAFRG
ncbi:MAG: threonylcarbamoyl-AMP synthase [Planctomycetota bacterium]|nr:MAG: threonylcarbamoyl-AMP synthase [Planctomycetota bacterium]